MKKNYIYLIILIVATIIFTLLGAYFYKKEIKDFSFAYENLNKIESHEFEEYMIEHPDAIIYISEKTDLKNNKFEKKLVKKLEKLNLLENVIYLESQEIIDIYDLLEKKYNYDYKEMKLPIILVIGDGKTLQVVSVNEKSDVSNIINYEVFK